MATEPKNDTSLEPRLAELTAQLETLKQAPALVSELRQLVNQLFVEREQTRERLEQVQAERDRLQVERNRLLHAYADLAFPEEELRQVEQEGPGRTLAEIWERLGKT